MKYFVYFFLIVTSSVAFADEISGTITMNFINVVENAIPAWIKMSTEAALQVFLLLWCFETFTQIIFKNVLGNNMKQLPAYLITRICFGGFFAQCLLKPDFYLGVIQYFASKTTGLSFVGNTIKGFDAGWVFKQFDAWTIYIYNPIQNSLGLSQIGQSISYALLFDVYMVCTCAISLMIIILEVEIYMTVYGALVLSGFAGSSWTYSLWARYMDAVIGLGIRIMVFGMLYGLLKILINIDPMAVGSGSVISSTVSIILTTACLWKIPNKIAGMVSGSSAGSSLAEAGAATLAGMALGKRIASKVPSFSGGGGSNGGGSRGGGSKSTSSLNSASASTKMPSSPPSPSGSGSGKDSSMPPMPPDWENDQPPPAPPPPNHMPPDWDG